jgi:hypothetical protein
LRHSAITIGLDAGVSLRDMQDFARHADPMTTSRYDRAHHAGVGYLTLGATYLAIAVVSGRAYIHVDDTGVHWRGLARRNHMAWHALDHIVVDP